MISVTAGYGPGLGDNALVRPAHGGSAAILLWMHNGLEYIYGRSGLAGQSRRAMPQKAKGREYEHRAIYRQGSEVERRRAVHEGHAAVSAVRFFRTGGADPRSHRGRLQGIECP